MDSIYHDFLWWALAALLVAAMAAAIHALLYKRDPRAAWGWIALCIIFPPLGPFLYLVFGINRVRSKGRKLQTRAPFDLGANLEPASHGFNAGSPEAVDFANEQAKIAFAMTGRPLTSGNDVSVLTGGEEAYPAMLRAIKSARSTVYLATYIFEANGMGHKFIDALEEATNRGVDVRVLVDGIGDFHGLPRSSKELQRRSIPSAQFLPPRFFPPSLSLNLRMHHKILTVDDSIGFTGGMNIGDTYLANDTGNPKRARDVHFLFRGPVVQQLEEIFLWNWGFATGEETRHRSQPSEEHGDVFCRTVVDGPNEDMDTLATIYIGAITSARRSIHICMPYFLPPREMIKALQIAAHRGVAVHVILPEHNDNPVVHRATRNMLWEVLEYGVQVHYQPGPFSHTKLFAVDDAYAIIGSSNLDPRSLRLNFELGMELYDANIATSLRKDMDLMRDKGRRITLDEVDNRPFPTRLADSVCWLFSPYL